MSGIEELKGKISSKNGLAFANQFSVELPLTIGTSVKTKLSGVDKRALNLLCKSVTMPGKQIATLDRQVGIYTEKVVNGFALEDVTMTFYMLNDYGVRRYFDSWRETMVGDARTTKKEGGLKDGIVGYKKNYVGDVIIHQLSKPQFRLGIDLGPLNIDFDLLGKSIYSVKLIEAFPTTMNSIELSNDLDGIVEMTVSFSFTNWEVIKDSRGLIDPKIGLNLGGLI